MQSINEKLLNASIKHSINIDSLGAEEARKLSKLLEEADDNITKILIDSNFTSISRKRLVKILNEIHIINAEAYKILEKKLTSKLQDIAEYEIDFNQKLLETSLPIGLTVSSVSSETIKAIVKTNPLQGEFIGDWVKKLNATKQRKITVAIKMGVIEGETNYQILRRIKGSSDLNFKDGIIRKSKNEVEKLVRTSINNITTRARDELYSANSKLVKKWRFVATLDSRTSLICASLDGKTYDTGTGPMPPRHFNCRSTTSPIVKSWKEMGIELGDYPEGTRSTLDGQIPEKMNYESWLRTQDKEFIEGVLGKKRSELFIDKKLNMDQFINNSNKIYSLEELKSRDSSLFK